MTTGPSEHRPRNSTTRVEIFANDALSAIGFYTRLPAWRLVPAERPGDSAGSQWAAPLAGILIGLLLGLLNGAIDALDLPELSRGLLVVGAGILLTGALHEDGFADLADGFGGGTDRQRKLAIMKDSRLGSYGALALVVSVILRASLVAVLTEPAEAALALVAAHAASRALMLAMLHHLPNARGDGVAFSVGRPASRIVAIALAIGLLALLPLGPLMLLFSLVALAAVYAAVAALALRQIGGQTGDVCGTLQQIAEIAVLAVCATMLT